jgi:hypothetical protein
VIAGPDVFSSPAQSIFDVESPDWAKFEAEMQKRAHADFATQHEALHDAATGDYICHYRLLLTSIGLLFVIFSSGCQQVDCFPSLSISILEDNELAHLSCKSL